MGLRVYWALEEASRTHEVDFWPQFQAGMRFLFDQRGYDGVLIGWPPSKNDDYLRPDAVIITANNVVLVDFKEAADDSELLRLPDEGNWYSEPWMVYPIKETTGSMPRPVSSGSNRNKNPFDQLQKQRRRFTEITGLEKLKTCVLIQSDPTIDGEIPKMWASFFKVARASTFPRDIDSLLNTRADGDKIDIENLMSHFSFVEYREISDFAFQPKEEMQELRQKVDELALQLHKTQAELLKLHKEKSTFNEQPTSVKQRIVDLSRSEAQQLRLYEMAAEKFIAQKQAETARYNAEAEKYRARNPGRELEAAKPFEKKSAGKFALLFGAVLLFAAAAGVGWAQYQIVEGPATGLCNPISEISTSTDCVEFTPMSVGFSSDETDAYLNDVERANYRDGKFFVAIPDFLEIFDNPAEIEALVGSLIEVRGGVSTSSDGRYKITISSASQILQK